MLKKLFLGKYANAFYIGAFSHSLLYEISVESWGWASVSFLFLLSSIYGFRKQCKEESLNE